MIHINKLHEQFKLTVNRLDSNYNKTFAVSVRDAYFNRAQDTIVERLMKLVEETPSLRNHLRVLERKNVELDIIEKKETYVVGEYPDDFYRLLRQQAYVTTTECKEERLILVRTVSSDKLTETLQDPYWEPNFEWEETVGDEGSRGYHVFKKPDWKVERILVDYMRKPQNMASFALSGCTEAAPYITSDGEVVKADRHCEFSDTYLWRYIADLAALFALRDLGQIDDAKTKMEEMVFSEIIKV